MATLLYRLGRFVYRHRRATVCAWLSMFAALGVGATVVGGSLDNEFSIPGSESQEALDQMGEDFPASAGTSALLVFQAPAGTEITDPGHTEAINEALATAAEVSEVVDVLDPTTLGTVSDDGRTAIAQVQFAVDRSDLDEDALSELEAAATEAEASGLRVEVGGDAYTGGVVSVSALELLGVLVALAVLVITLGSLAAAGMPLLTALVGIGIGISGLFLLARTATVSSTAVTLALMLGLAVGIDYALFILSRHRDQLASGMDPEESAARATGTAGSAVVFAGATVVIALAALSVVDIPFLTVMGLSAAAAVVIAVLVAITLVPALLGLAGARLTPKAGSRAERRRVRTGAGERWARVVVRRPLLTVLTVTGVLLVLAVPALDLRLALPDNGSAPEHSTEREAYDLIAAEFGPGYNGPLIVYAETPGGSEGRQSALLLASELAALPGVAVVSSPQYNQETGTALVTIIPTTAPDDAATEALVEQIRDQADELEEQTGADVAVTGTTAVGIDVSDRLAASLVPFLSIVVGLSMLLLLVVFRSIVVPIKAAAGFLLSAGAALGAVTAVFQWGWLADLLGVADTGPVVSFLPIVLIAVLFGLAMDYEVFLVSSTRETWLRDRKAVPAILTGAGQAARVVTAAALIMFAVFAGFVTSHDATVKAIAVALAFGVLIDAFVIRMTFGPAVLALAGRAAWSLPAWIERALPTASAEGGHGGGPRRPGHEVATSPASPRRRRILQTTGALAGVGALAYLFTQNRDERHEDGTQVAPVSASGTEVLLLGTAAGPVPSTGRSGIASVLVVKGRAYVVDFGHGAFDQFHRAGLTTEQLGPVFVTHLHSDHLADLYTMLWLRFGSYEGLVAPLEIYGPGPAGALPESASGEATATVNSGNPTPGLADYIAASIDASAYDLNIRMRDEQMPDIREMVRTHEIELPEGIQADALEQRCPLMEPFAVFEDDLVRVSAVLVDHPPVFPAFAFRFDTPHGSVVFSGDTTITENVVTLAQGADVLVHEVIDLVLVERYGGLSEEQLEHHRNSHSDVTEIGAHAERAGVRTLVLNHLAPGTTLVPDQTWRAKAGQGFSGDVVVGRDLLRIPL